MNKPKVQKKILKQYRKHKWEHADEVREFFENRGIDVDIFEKSIATPHMRISGHVDYWPASSRFIDLKTKKWGAGYSQLKTYILNESLCQFPDWEKE